MSAAPAPALRLGAHVAVDALVAAGVRTFFMNPGTSEVHLVSAIDGHPDADPVLCLFEGVATGAADGYARACGKPAAVLLHLGPGLANGLANLHNAKKARSPMIVLVGEHATSHLAFDTPLNSDLGALAGYAAKQVFHLAPGDDIRRIIGDAVRVATTVPAGPVVVVANVDAMWSSHTETDAGICAPAQQPAASPDPDRGAIAAMAQALARPASGRAALVLGGAALSAEGADLADRIAQHTGCALYCETFNARQERGAGIAALKRIPYFREAAVPELEPYGAIVLVGARPPVSFFASPDEPSELTGTGARLLSPGEQICPMAALRALARATGAWDAIASPRPAMRAQSETPAGKLNARAIWAAMNRHMPAGAIVSDEAGVTSAGADEAMLGAEPHTWLNLTGGSIGQAVPVATGAALARRGQRVFAMQGDGGAMYTMQALWTQVRERLNVVNVILRNDRYAILDYEVKRHGIEPLSPKGARMFDLTDPAIDWTGLASSLGMSAVSAGTAEEFATALAAAVQSDGPTLIEARLGGKRPAS